MLLLPLLREYGPLKQGLRPNDIDVGIPTCSTLREYGPLKQGLRHSKSVAICYLVALREYGPLKQGLRLSTTSIPFSLKSSESMVH